VIHRALFGNTERQTFAVSVTYFLSGGRIGIGRAATAGGGGRRAAGELYFGPRRYLRLSDFDTHTMCAVRLVGASDQMHAVTDVFRYGGYIEIKGDETLEIHSIGI